MSSVRQTLAPAFFPTAVLFSVRTPSNYLPGVVGAGISRFWGRNGSRPKALTNHQLLMAKTMLGAPDVSVQQVADHFGVARSTLYRLLEKTPPGKVAEEDAA